MIEDKIERRPDSTGRSAACFPREWGNAPANVEERKAWIARNVRAGEQRRAAGEKVDWLAKETR